MHDGACNKVTICPLRSKKCNGADIKLASKQSGVENYYNKVSQGYFLQKQALEQLQEHL
jgi:hypothetical protein